MIHRTAFEARHSAHDNNIVEIFDFDLILVQTISEPTSRVNLRSPGGERIWP